jgi:hypothetical protein
LNEAGLSRRRSQRLEPGAPIQLGGEEHGELIGFASGHRSDGGRLTTAML